jgi:diguanylate cyclase
VFDDRMREEVVERLEIEQSLRRAGPQGELQVAYQPQVDLVTGAVVGVEALVRWHHPRQGLMMPDSFIGVAEDLGLIGTIGSFVLGETCREAMRLDGAHPDISVAVNLSPRQLAEPTLVQQVVDNLTRSGLPAERLVIEITENALLEESWGSADVLADLRRAGVRVSIDDFGTGYSSLSYLTRMRVDEVKIDKSFTSGLGTDPGRTAIVGAVIAMGHALGLRVVAEGVERADQLAMLQELGCDWGQGWLWSPGRPAPDLHHWLATAAPDQH